MDRRQALTGLLALAGVPLYTKDKDKDKDKDHGKGKGPKNDSYYFRREDYGPIERYYNGPRDLPPGLRKKYYRTGKLPPGWEKKIQPFPPDLARQLPPPPPNCERGYIDGVAVVYDRNTRIIMDSIDLISAIAGH
jgi:hypothetical protein